MLAQLLILLLVVEKTCSVPTPLESTPYYPPDEQQYTLLPNETRANTTTTKHTSTVNHVLSFTNDLIHLHEINHPFAWLMNNEHIRTDILPIIISKIYIKTKQKQQKTTVQTNAKRTT